MTTNFPRGSTSVLRAFLSSVFKSNEINAYYQEADKNAQFPYIVWELRHVQALTDDGGKAKRYIMEINAYHKSSTVILDDMLDFIEEKLDGLMANTSSFFVAINSIYDRLDIEDSREIKRKRISFEVKYYIKEC